MIRARLAALLGPLATLHRTGRSRRTSSEHPDRPGPMITDGGPDARDDDHLRDVPDGAGCTEIWEHLSGHAGEERDD